MKIMRRVVIFSLVIYAIIVGVIYSIQEVLVFNFAPVTDDHIYQFERSHDFITLTPKNDVRLHGVRFLANSNKKSDQVILYFKGNAGNIGRSESMAIPYLELGYDFISMDYRDFGKSKGSFDEEGLLSDAIAWHDYAVEHYGQENVKVLAWSMGAAFAAHVAANTNVKDFIVFAPFKSVVDMGYRRYPFFVHEWLSRFPLRSDLRLSDLADTQRYVIYHGTDDRIVPYESGKGLYEAADKTSVEFITVKGANHFDIPWRDDVLKDVLQRWKR